MRGSTVQGDVAKASSPVQNALTEAIAELCRKDVGEVLVIFDNITEYPLQSLWVNFAQRNMQDAEKLCYEMRKRGGVSAVSAYFLSKMLFNLVRGKNVKVFAWCALDAIKALQGEEYEKKVSYRARIIGIVKELNALAIDNKTKPDSILRQQIVHYTTVYLATEEHLAVAFAEQRAKYLENPEDFDNLRYLGWTLHDCIKQSIETLVNKKLVEFFANELSRLKYPEAMSEKDPKLVNCYESDLRKAKEFLDGVGEVRVLERSNDLSSALAAAESLVKAQPNNVAAHLALARVYDKLSRHKESLREYLAADNITPNDDRAQTCMAWAFVRFVGGMIKEGKWSPTVEKVVLRGIALFDKFSLLQKPSLVYSQIMRVLTKCVRAAGKDVPWGVAGKYVAFVKAWGTGNFTQDDYKPFVPKDKPDQAYPSLVEIVTSTLYRCAITNSREGKAIVKDNEWIVGFVGTSVERFPAQQWYPYYYGKLLVALGRCDEARKYIIKTAQRKLNEFWVWQMLAETYPDNVDRQLMCLCRAALCRVQEDTYLAAVHEMLGKALRAKGMDAEALLEFGVVDKLRAAKGWKRVSHGEDYAVWSKNLVPALDNRNLYTKWAALADEIVMESLPSVNAVVTAKYFDRERKEAIARLWWAAENRSGHEVRVKVRRFRLLNDIEVGAPVRVWSDLINGHETVLKVEPRSEGVKWDAYPKTLGVIVAHDERRGHSVFVIDDEGRACTGDWLRNPQVKDMPLGSLCDLIIMTNRGHCDLLDCRLSENGSLPGFVREYSGGLRIAEGKRFGFVGDVFVPVALMEGCVGVSAGASVHGRAARSYDRTKNRLSWKAVTIEVNS